MKVITNNGQSSFLLDLLKNPEVKKHTKAVKIAVWLLNESYLKPVKVFCEDQKIPLFCHVYRNNCYPKNNYYSKIEDCIKQHDKILHSKVYWFVGYGVYIGSANFCKEGWEQNTEFGLFLYSKKSSSNYYMIKNNLKNFFKELESNEMPVKKAG